MKLYILTHKNFHIPEQLPEVYFPLQVGALFHRLPGIPGDHTGENISSRNALYNELTGLYWIWKNCSEDIIGLCHYRRYFVTPLGKAKNLLFGKQENFLTEPLIRKYLHHYDILVHNRTFFPQGVYRQLIDTENITAVKILEKSIYASGTKYLAAFHQVLQQRHIHLLNMFIAPKQVLDSYSEWLFPVLFRTEQMLRNSAPDVLKPRTMGMLGERLLDVWIIANNIKVKECFSINTERIDWKPL